MVRRAERGSVAVWVALGDARRVSLEARAVGGSTSEPAAAGVSDTVALGGSLHVVVVVAEGDLDWGHLYTYNLEFEPVEASGSEVRGDLFAPGILVAEDDPADAERAALALLSYQRENSRAPRLPSFVLPPEDLDHVRIIHGSCRVPHARGRDAFDALDTMLAHAAHEAHARPQQLFLTGDQIYVNNIAPEILPALTAAGAALLGWDETLPGVDKTPQEYPPLTREKVVREHAGLLEYGDSSHLLGLGEIYALYLFNFSEVLWPKSWQQSARGKRMNDHLAALPGVRRALANIATFMIFDDHEVTDDWALTLEWCQSVLAKPLGRRLLMNTLAGYAVFQAWGNTPAQFAEPSEGDPLPPGRRLLDALAAWRGAGESEREIAALLGIPASAEEVLHRSPPQLSPPTGAVEWFYRWRGPRYQVLVVDGRTWRAYPGASNVDRPDLLSEAALDAQLVAPGELDAPLTVIVSSSAILPFPKPWYARAAMWCSSNWKAIKRGFGRKYAQVYDRDRGEAWQGQTPGFERLLATLATNTPAATGRHQLRAVVLAGDIHIGHAARLQYWADRPWREGAAAETPASMVWAYFTSSPIRNQNSGTRMAHKVGYGLFGGPPRFVWAGWHEAPAIALRVPAWFAGFWRTPRPTGAPSMLDFRRHQSIQSSEPPDWTYRVDFLDGNPEPGQEGDNEGIPSPAGLAYAPELIDEARRHRARVCATGRGRSIVGVNHIAEIRLHWREDHKGASQTLWWRPTADAAPLPLTTFEVSLDFDEPAAPTKKGTGTITGAAE